jgi:methionyl-tRNA formyltransferase
LIDRLRTDFRDTFYTDQHPFRFPGDYKHFPSKDLETVARFLWNDRPDIVLCCGFHRRIPIGILTSPKLAAVNIHAGLLPERGGGTPTRWAIREGDAEIGVTAHIMTEHFDAGPIIWQERISLPVNATQGQAEQLLRPIVLRALCYVIEAAGDEHGFTGTPQTPEIQPSYRGEALKDIPEPAACRAMLPKACPYGLRQCRRQSKRPCGVTF